MNLIGPCLQETTSHDQRKHGSHLDRRTDGHDPVAHTRPVTRRRRAGERTARRNCPCNSTGMRAARSSRPPLQMRFRASEPVNTFVISARYSADACTSSLKLALQFNAASPCSLADDGIGRRLADQYALSPP